MASLHFFQKICPEKQIFSQNVTLKVVSIHIDLFTSKHEGSWETGSESDVQMAIKMALDIFFKNMAQKLIFFLIDESVI